jgi:hypothetical protein
LVRGIIRGAAFRYGTSNVCPGFINQPGGRFSFENVFTIGLRYQNGGAVIEEHGTCVRWWKGDRQYSSRKQKNFHVLLP